MGDNFFDSFPELDSAIIDENNNNPLAFGSADYPSKEVMLSSPEFNSDVIHTIDILSLCRNGVVIRDEMSKYLKNKANSSSALKEILKTPFHYKFYKEQKTKDDGNKKHFELGTFAHMAFLEPEMFNNVIIAPEHPQNTTSGVVNMIRWFEKINREPNAALDDLKMRELRDYQDELRSRCQYTLIDEPHQIIIDAIRSSYTMYGGGIIKRILKGAVAETSFYGKDKATGIPVKVRPDYFNISENIGVNAIISFKTTSANNINKFFYDAGKYQYELSEGMYQEVMSDITGRKFNVTIMIMLQTVPPYLPAVFYWSPEDIANGKYKYRYALDTLVDCNQKKLFPGFDAKAESGFYGIIDMQMPEWTQKTLHPVDIEM